jgi:hypothetical protein
MPISGYFGRQFVPGLSGKKVLVRPNFAKLFILRD